MLKRLLLLLLLIAFPSLMKGQCMIVPETLENLIAPSELVVEGKVRSQQSYYDEDNNNIYTVSEVELFKIFKGIPLGTIKVVTQGGVVGLEMDQVSNALEMEVGDMGMFLLQDFSGTLPLAETLYRPTETVLGFIRYDLATGTAHGVYESYANITTELYGTINSITGIPILDQNPWDTEDAEISGESPIEKSIVSEVDNTGNTTFTVHAGVGDLLTITGADFGNEQGRILFPDANTGGRQYIAALDYQIQEWTADQISVEVPYRAGTGKIRIDKASGESLIGSENLPIGYDHINVKYNDGGGTKSYETQLTSDNETGGYTFQFENGFSQHSGASQAFTNLLETWGCATGVNFQIGAPTDVDEDANDGINIVRFDNGDELGGRTLAYARSRYRGCFQDGTIKWFVNEIEVVVNDDYDWYYGNGIPGASQFDFETVMLHEIGHTQQLGHVINSNEVMHFAVGPRQQKRQLSDIDTIGGIFVTDKSTLQEVCGRELMQSHDACCEALTVVSHPSDRTVCSSENEVFFEFATNFSEQVNWEEKIGEQWIALNDNSKFSGTHTKKLEVRQPFETEAQYRAIAKNECGDTTVSEIARLVPLPSDFSMDIEQPSCESIGAITIEGDFSTYPRYVSLNGGQSFDHSWDSGENRFQLEVLPGSYDIKVRYEEGYCISDLGQIMIAEVTPLQLEASLYGNLDCENDTGNVVVYFNDHPVYDSVRLSIDNGKTFQSYDDDSGFVVFENLNVGEYEVLGMWQNESCGTVSNALRIASVSLPEVAVEVVRPNCSESTGALVFRFDSIADFDQVEISLDAGSTYSHAFGSTSEEHKIAGLSPGNYAIWARWAGLQCGRSVGVFSVENKIVKSAICLDITVNLDETGSAEISPEKIFDGMACPKVELILDQTSFDCDHIGQNEIILTITDSEGNTSSCFAMVTVTDSLNFCNEITGSNSDNEDVDNPKTIENPERNEDLTVKLYPNPTNERIFVKSKDKPIQQFQLFNARGTLLKNVVPQKQNEDTYFMNVSYLPSGVYLLKIRGEYHNTLKQFIIE